MIIKGRNSIGKKFKFLILAFSFFLDIIIISTIIAIIIIFVNSSELTNNYNIVLLMIFALLNTISIADIIEIFSKRKSIAFYFSQKILNKLESAASTPLILNTVQKSFCETIYGIENKNSYIYVFGKNNKGKTTAVLYLLDGLLKNSENLIEIPWINNFTFIDCTSNKNEILDYFFMNNSENNRVKRFSNSLTVIDNIEHLGQAFFEENVGLFGSYKSLFIIIEDTKNDSPMCNYDAYDRSLLKCNFNTSVIGIKPMINLLAQLKSLNEIDRKIFFSIYFLTLSSEFANVDEIRTILNISNVLLYKSLKKIKNLNIYVPFPFNKKYYYCSNRIYIKKIGNIISEFAEYKNILETFIKSNIANPECQWLCYIYSEEDIIMSLSDNEKTKLFQKALYNGKYLELYNELNNCIEKNPNKENLFLYEKGFLSFYIGNHKEATHIFLKLINKIDSINKRKEMMLNIIESSHGNPDIDNMNLIYSFINEIQSENDFYSVCAFYWKKHIDTEKGKFEYNVFDSIRNKLIGCFISFNKSLYKSIQHRSFLDEIRCCHILGIQPSNELLIEYTKFLQTCSQVRNDYYSNLYIEANTIHYVNLIDMLISDDSSYEEIVAEAQKAEIYYDRALGLPYSDEKSKRATKIKQLDLRMIYSDFDYQNTVNQINIFRIHSQINDVLVHEAFCETLLIKAKILKPDNISNDLGINFNDDIIKEIYIHFNKGYEIYQKYGNLYGIFRLEFLMLLLDILTTNHSNRMCIEKINLFKRKYKEYPKEIRILESLLTKFKKQSCSLMYVLSIIRAYPIILQ